MKKIILFLSTMFLIFFMSGCTKETPTEKEVNGNLKTYYEVSNGTWKCDDFSYRYRLEISGRMPNAAVDSTFVYLSNQKKMSFEQAWKAAGLSSFSGDYFPLEDAVLVEWRTD